MFLEKHASKIHVLLLWKVWKNPHFIALGALEKYTLKILVYYSRVLGKRGCSVALKMPEVAGKYLKKNPHLLLFFLSRLLLWRTWKNIFFNYICCYKGPEKKCFKKFTFFAPNVLAKILRNQCFYSESPILRNYFFTLKVHFSNGLGH